MINRLLLSFLEHNLNNPTTFQEVFGLDKSRFKVLGGTSSKRSNAWYLSIVDNGFPICMFHTRGTSLWLKYFVTEVSINDSVQTLMMFNAISTFGVVNFVKSIDPNYVRIYYETKISIIDILILSRLSKLIASIVLEATRTFNNAVAELYDEEISEGRSSEFILDKDIFYEDEDDEDDGDGTIHKHPHPQNLN